MARKEICLKTVNEEILGGFSWECINPVGCVFISTGMEEHALRYDEFANFLSSNGYNVYCLDFYGQGVNAKTENELGIVPRSFFSKSVRILDDLVKKFAIKNKPVIVLGHSMGSFIIQDYIQRYSKKANKAILIGTDGPESKVAYSFGYQLARLICKLRGEQRQAKFLKSLAVGSYAKSVKHRKTDCDWLSYNEENVNNYIADPKSGHPSSNGFYRELLKGNHRLYKEKFLKKINPEINILITSGVDDAVGKMGKGPKALKELYDNLGIKNVELKLYENMRHEILQENNKEVVFNDILKFIQK